MRYVPSTLLPLETLELTLRTIPSGGHGGLYECALVLERVSHARPEDAFATGRCAIALGPPGCWKGAGKLCHMQF